MKSIAKDWLLEEQQNHEVVKFDEYSTDPFFLSPRNMDVFTGLPNELKALIDGLPYSIFRLETVLRMHITAVIKMGSDHADLLKLYYKIKCIQSFWIPYSAYSETAGMEIVRKIPGCSLLKLATPYKQFGYKLLPCKTKKEIKWFIDQWGEPDNHTSMHIAYHSIWHKFERAVKLGLARRDVELGIMLIPAIRMIDEFPESDSEKYERLLSIVFPLGFPYPESDRFRIAQLIHNDADEAFRGVDGQLHLFLDEVTDANLENITSMRYLDVIFTFARLAAKTYKEKTLQT